MRLSRANLPRVPALPPASSPVPITALRYVGLVALVLYGLASASGLIAKHLPASASHWVSGGLLVLAATLCLLRAALVAGQRPIWGVIGAGLLSWAAGELFLAVAPGSAGHAFSVADLLSLAFYPASYIALAMLLRARLREFLTTLWLDGLAGALSVCALAAAFVLPPVLANHRGAPFTELVGFLCYPLADLLLVACVVFALAMTGWRPGAFLATVAVALAAVAITDAFSLWWASTGHSTARMQWSWLWPASALVIAEVAWRVSPPLPAVNNTSLRLLIVPLGFSLTALALLLSGLMHELDSAGYELAVSALLLIVVRLAVTVLDNLHIAEASKQEAMTDALTGLGNRRKLMLDVEQTLEPGKEGTALVLFDLDGFKLYNDTFGHPAGDALLARLGHALEETARPYGSAYRLGGDEFCILVRAESGDVVGSIEEAVAALSEHGSGFSVTPSHGSVRIPDDAADITLAFQLADQRLYLQKGSRRRSRDCEQVRDVLMQALREKQPDLDEHIGGVASLAQAVARALGLTAEEVDEVTRAAELHDIGKMAVPDAILSKPAGLDDSERALMRQQTVIGERILAVAPALRSVGTLVRHSHERYDGHGYPDGLVGEEIPMGARVIAVCDAFDAMTTDRPYQSAVPLTEALAELQRCAGGQFDPVVVEAFCQEAMRMATPTRASAEPRPELAPVVGAEV